MSPVFLISIVICLIQTICGIRSIQNNNVQIGLLQIQIGLVFLLLGISDVEIQQLEAKLQH